MSEKHRNDYILNRMGLNQSIASQEIQESTEMNRDRSFIKCHPCAENIDYDEIVFAKKCVRCTKFYHQNCFVDIPTSATYSGHYRDRNR